MWCLMVVGLVAVPSKNIMHMGTCIQAFKCLAGMTRIGIAIPGNGLAMCSIFCACIMGFPYKRAGNGYKRELGTSKKKGVGMGVLFALLIVIGVIVLVRSLRIEGCVSFVLWLLVGLAVTWFLAAILLRVVAGVGLPVRQDEE